MKKLVCAAMSVVIALMMATTAFADMLSSDGYVVTKTERTDFSYTTDGSGDGWQWDAASKTFTLSGCTADEIVIPLNSTLCVHGTNDIGTVSGGGSLKIIGDGVLKVSHGLSSSYSYDDEGNEYKGCLTIDGTLTVEAINTDSEELINSVGIRVSTGDFIVLNGTVKAGGDYAGIFAANIKISGGAVTAESGSEMIEDLDATKAPAALIANNTWDGSEGNIEIAENMSMVCLDASGASHPAKFISSEAAADFGTAKTVADENGSIATKVVIKPSEGNVSEEAGTSSGSSDTSAAGDSTISNPKTGDGSSIALGAALLAASGCALIVTASRGKKRAK